MNARNGSGVKIARTTRFNAAAIAAARKMHTQRTQIAASRRLGRRSPVERPDPSFGAEIGPASGSCAIVKKLVTFGALNCDELNEGGQSVA